MKAKIRELVAIAMGQASIAWSKMPEGHFLSEWCERALDHAVNEIMKEIKRKP